MRQALIRAGFIGSGKLTTECVKLAPSQVDIRFTTSTKTSSSLTASIPNHRYNSNLNQPCPFLADITHLIVCIAPSDQRSYENTYLTTSKDLIEKLKDYPNISHLLYISSTSVYNSQPTAIENQKLDPSQMRPNQKVLYETENAFLSLKDKLDSVTVLRSGRILSNTTPRLSSVYPGSGNETVNYIHRSDLASMMWHLILNSSSGIYNAVNPDHPTRKEFYSYWHIKENLAQPTFNGTENSFHISNKLVSSDKVLETGFKFSKNWQS